MKMPDILLSNLRDMVFEKNIEKIKAIKEPEKELRPDDFITLGEVNLIILESLEEEDVQNFAENEQILFSISLSQNTLKNIFLAIKTRIFTNFMQQLVSGGFLECAFSDEKNDFIFLVSEKGEKSGIKEIPKIF